MCWLLASAGGWLSVTWGSLKEAKQCIKLLCPFGSFLTPLFMGNRNSGVTHFRKLICNASSFSFLFYSVCVFPNFGILRRYFLFLKAEEAKLTLHICHRCWPFSPASNVCALVSFCQPWYKLTKCSSREYIRCGMESQMWYENWWKTHLYAQQQPFPVGYFQHQLRKCACGALWHSDIPTAF